MSSFSNEDGLRKGVWTDEEDQILRDFIYRHGVDGWSNLPLRAGLKRTGKSCRLRWLNYLRPDLVRGNITQEEAALIVRLHKLLGNRWSLIAGRLPGRSDNEIKNYWKTKLKIKVENGEYRDILVNPSHLHQSKGKEHYDNKETVQVIRPKATKCTKVYIDPLYMSTMSILQPQPPPPNITSSKLQPSSSTLMAPNNLESDLPVLEEEKSWGFDYNMDDHEIAKLYEDFNI